MKNKPVYLVVIIFLLFFVQVVFAEILPREKIDVDVEKKAFECRKKLVAIFHDLVKSKKLTVNQLFDTFYIPIPGTNPQKFRTQYDSFTDKLFRPVLDRYLTDKIVFVVAVDRNGYLPTHNSKFSHELTGVEDFDLKQNRTKRIFNDTTGLKAARNKKSFLLQKYYRDTGEVMYDYSIPIFFNDRHWGALRFGYTE
jgi:hypothetical protein